MATFKNNSDIESQHFANRNENERNNSNSRFESSNNSLNILEKLNKQQNLFGKSSCELEANCYLQTTSSKSATESNNNNNNICVKRAISKSNNNELDVSASDEDLSDNAPSEELSEYDYDSRSGDRNPTKLSFNDNKHSISASSFKEKIHNFQHHQQKSNEDSSSDNNKNNLSSHRLPSSNENSNSQDYSSTNMARGSYGNQKYLHGDSIKSNDNQYDYDDDEDSNDCSVIDNQMNNSKLNGDQNNKSTDETNANQQKKQKCDLICVVCGAPANGYNFDAITCESCKAFFRRNAFRPINVFRCANNNQCVINMVTRKKCKRCRIMKCFSLGMRRDWIMTEGEREEKRRKIEENRRKKATGFNENSNEDDYSMYMHQQMVVGGPNLLMNDPNFLFYQGQMGYDDAYKAPIRRRRRRRRRHSSSNQTPQPSQPQQQQQQTSSSSASIKQEQQFDQIKQFHHDNGHHHLSSSKSIMDSFKFKQEKIYEHNHQNNNFMDQIRGQTAMKSTLSHSQISLPIINPQPNPKSLYENQQFNESISLSSSMTNAIQTDEFIYRADGSRASSSSNHHPLFNHHLSNQYMMHNQYSNNMNSNNKSVSVSPLSTRMPYSSTTNEDDLLKSLNRRKKSLLLSNEDLKLTSQSSAILEGLAAKSQMPFYHQTATNSHYVPSSSSQKSAFIGNQSPLNTVPYLHSSSSSSETSNKFQKLDSIEFTNINRAINTPPSMSTSPVDSYMPSFLNDEQKGSIVLIQEAYKQAIRLVKAQGTPKEIDDIDTTINVTELAVRRIIFFFKMVPDFRNLHHDLMVKLLRHNMMKLLQINGVGSYNKQTNSFKEPDTDDVAFTAESLEAVYGPKVCKELMDVTTSMYDLCDGNFTFIKILLLMTLYDPLNDNLNNDQEKNLVESLQSKYIALLYSYLRECFGSPKAELKYKGFILELSKIGDLAKWFEKTVSEEANHEYVRPLMKEVFSLPNGNESSSTTSSSPTSTNSASTSELNQFKSNQPILDTPSTSNSTSVLNSAQASVRPSSSNSASESPENTTDDLNENRVQTRYSSNEVEEFA